MGFDLENYEPVAVRLARWLEQVEGGQPRVLTHLVHFTEDGWAIFRAELWVDETLIATGWAEERKDSSPITRTNWLEVAETSALGRALANAGLAGSDPAKRPSREEMQKVARAGGTGGASGPGSSYPSLASEKQTEALRRMGKRRGHNDDEALAEALTLLLGKRVGILTLTRADASAAIGEWSKVDE